MNAERLHSLVLSVQEDLKDTQVNETLGALRDSLESQVNQPQQAQHQQEVARHLQELRTALAGSITNEYSPTWVQALQGLNIYDLTGERLANRLDEIFSRNQITPSVALDEVSQVFDALQGLRTNVLSLRDGLAGLGIGAEELSPGLAELGFLVPRKAVKNDLRDFGRELQQLDRTLGVFAEVATGTREGFQVRSIASSDLSVFLDALPKVAACAAVAIERVVALYKKLLEIRRLRQELADQGVPAEKLSGIESHADEFMKAGLKPLVEEIIAEYYQGNDKKRANELRKNLESSLNEIATRVDRGYHFEVRVEPLPTAPEGEDVDPSKKHVVTILRAQPGLQFFRAQGEPILCLPESTDAADGGKNDGGQQN